MQWPHLFWRLYVTLWIALSSVALAYILISVNQPDFYARITGIAVLETKRAEQVKQANVTAELQRLRNVVEDLDTKLELFKKRPALTQAHTQPPEAIILNSDARHPPHGKDPELETAQPSHGIDQSVSFIGSASPSSQEQSDKAEPTHIPPLPTRGYQGKFAENSTQKSGRKAATGYEVSVINEVPKSIITGSIDIAAPEKESGPKSDLSTAAAPPFTAFGQTTVTFASNSNRLDNEAPFAAVVISAASSLDDLRSTWRRLANQHPDLLGRLEARYDFMGSPEARYRLLSGPLSSSSEADRLCLALVRNNINCSVGEFVGNAL